MVLSKYSVLSMLMTDDDDERRETCLLEYERRFRPQVPTHPIHPQGVPTNNSYSCTVLTVVLYRMLSAVRFVLCTCRRINVLVSTYVSKVPMDSDAIEHNTRTVWYYPISTYRRASTRCHTRVSKKEAIHSASAYHRLPRFVHIITLTSLFFMLNFNRLIRVPVILCRFSKKKK